MKTKYYIKLAYLSALFPYIMGIIKLGDWTSQWGLIVQPEFFLHCIVKSFVYYVICYEAHDCIVF